MKINKTAEIEAFIRRCRNNLSDDRRNRFVGMSVTKQNQDAIRQKMRKAGYAEFFGPQETWPSLFIDTDQYRKSPYNSTIRLENVVDANFRFATQTMPAGELFSVSAILPDENRELADWMRLRALSEPYEAAFLWQDDEVWMMDSPSEAATIDPVAQKAKGKVLTFGLGIGYFIFMAMRNPDVTSITVIERSTKVIDLFNRYLLPQFPKSIPLMIVQGDAFDYFNESYLSQFDFTFVDIWQSSDDGLLLIESLLNQYLPPFESTDFWIESSCFELVTGLIFHYFDLTVHQKPIRHPDPQLSRILRKIATYFNKFDTSVSDLEVLKNWMYDRRTIREILAIRLD